MLAMHPNMYLQRSIVVWAASGCRGCPAGTGMATSPAVVNFPSRRVQWVCDSTPSQLGNHCRWAQYKAEQQRKRGVAAKAAAYFLRAALPQAWRTWRSFIIYQRVVKKKLQVTPPPAAVLQPYCSLTAALLQPYCSLTAALLQPYCSLTVALLRPYCGLTAALLQPYCGRCAPPVVLQSICIHLNTALVFVLQF
jgi:hypothetical protein